MSERQHHDIRGRSKAALKLLGLTLILLLLVGCHAPIVMPGPLLGTSAPPQTAYTLTPPQTSIPTAAPVKEYHTGGLSDEEVATLSSLEKVDHYPLYTMRYYGAYEEIASLPSVLDRMVSPNSPDLASTQASWGCSLFTAPGEAGNMLYGRNFDWDYSPALLLYTYPPDGYASVSTVDIAYLGFTQSEVQSLTELSLTKRKALLDAPGWPFDGFNEKGLAVGMAAVPSSGQMQPDPEKETISSLMVIREILDHASDAGEAVALMQSYNIDMVGGPSLHYLIADPSGRSVLVEFFQGEMIITYNEAPWQVATNFLRAEEGDCSEGRCWRYDTVSQRLLEAQGQLTTQNAMDLLAEVSQDSTQWSILYGMSTGEISVVMGRGYEEVHTLHLDLEGE